MGWALAFLAIALLLYGATVAYPFQFDGIFYVQHNPLLKDIRNFALWSHFSEVATAYERVNLMPDLATNFVLRPVSYFTFYLNYAFGGEKPESYHVVNILIHWANATLLFVVLRQVLARPGRTHLAGASCRFIPLAASILFLVHPLHTESVTYLVQRFSSLEAFFVLLAWWAALKAGLGTAALGAYRAAAVLALMLGMLSKESVVTAPVLIVVGDLLLFRESFRVVLRRSWLYLLTLPLLPMLVLLVSKVQHHGGLDLSAAVNIVNSDEHPASVLRYALTEPGVMLSYLRLLLLPMGQSVDPNPNVITTWSFTGFLLPVAAIIALLAASFFGARRHREDIRWALMNYGILWFFLTLLPSSSFIPLPDFMAEHRTYLPSLGFFMALAAGLDLLRESLLKSKNGARGFAAAMASWAVLLGYATVQRNEVWRSEILLWQDAVEKNPGKVRSWDNLAISHYQGGHTSEALYCLQRALDIDPAYTNAYCKMGLIYNLLARYPEALAICERGYKQSPQNADLPYNIGMAHLGMGQTQEAEDWLLKTLSAHPQHGSAHFSIGALYATLHQTDKALSHLKLAAQLMPEDTRVSELLAQVQRQQQMAVR